MSVALATAATFLLVLSTATLVEARVPRPREQTTTTPVRHFDLGMANDLHDRIRARTYEHMLSYLLGDAQVSLEAGAQLQLRVRDPFDLLEPDRHLAAQLPAVLAALLHAPPGRRAPAATLAAFRTRHDTAVWRCHLLRESLAKPLPRRICRAPDGRASLAETLRPDGSVRETEVVVARAERDTWDFHVYDGRGRLSLEADFGDGDTQRWLPSPASCAGCHYDPEADRFRQRPTFAEPSAPLPFFTSSSRERAP